MNDVPIQQSLLKKNNNRMPQKRKKKDAEVEKVNPDHNFIFTHAVQSHLSDTHSSS